MDQPNLILPQISGNMYGYNPNGVSAIMPNSVQQLHWAHGSEKFTITSDYCKAYNLSEEDTFFMTLTYGETLPHRLDQLNPIHNPILNMPIHATL